MAAIRNLAASRVEQAGVGASVRGGLAFDWTATALSAWVIGGVYFDGWAHNHGRVDDVFVTPWHAVLYSGVLAMFAFLAFMQWRNLLRGYSWRRALPDGYLPSLAGAILFILGGGLDFAWHSLFGVEVNIEALLSPSHLILATGGFLMISGPVRAAYARLLPGQARGWRDLAPLILCATFLWSILTFFTQFAHPLARLGAGAHAGGPAPNSNIYVMNADGSGQTRLTVDQNWSGWGSASSPDGRKIAYSSWADGDQRAELYVMNADGGGRSQLTHNGRGNYLPAWSPDGRRIAFISRATGTGSTSEVHVVDATGGNEASLTQTGSEVYGVSWSPDGRRLVYGANLGGWQLYVMNADGSGQTPLGPSSAGNAPAWSPDGSLIAFTSDRYGGDDIFTIQPDGNNVRRLTANPGFDDNPAWSPDGSRLAFGSARDGVEGIFVMAADGANIQHLTRMPAMWSGIPTWTADGGRILYTARGNPENPSWLVEPLEIAGILLQSALLMGLLLFLVEGWRLPFGAVTLIVGLNTALMSVFQDRYALLPGALAAGLLADVLLRTLRPSPARPGQYRLFAFVVPVVFYGLYFLSLQLMQGIAWTIHLWLGSVYMAGIVGLLVSFLVVLTARSP